MFYFYGFLWSVSTLASYYSTLPSGAHFNIIFEPQISSIFCAAKMEALHFHLKTGSGGQEGQSKASMEASTSVLTCALNPNKPLPPYVASFSCCSNGCFAPSTAGLGGTRASCLLVGMRRARSAHVSDATPLPRKHSAEWNNKFKNVFCHLTSLLIPGSATDLDLHGNHRLLWYNTEFLC